MTQWIVLIAVAAVVLYAIIIFNRLVRTRQVRPFAYCHQDMTSHLPDQILDHATSTERHAALR